MMRILVLSIVFYLGPVNLVGAAADVRGPGPPRWAAGQYIQRDRTVGLRWAPVAGADSYRLLRRTEEETGYAPVADTGGYQHFDRDVVAGTTYYYVVRALAGAREGPLSREKEIAVPAGPEGEIRPPGWRGHSVEAGGEEDSSRRLRVRLVWRPVPGAAGYRLYRSSAAGEEYEPVASTEATSFYDYDIAPGGEYYYVVTSFDGSLHESLKSLEQVVPVPPEAMLAAPAPPDAVLRPVERLWRVYNESPENVSLGKRAKLTHPFDVVCDRERGLVYVSSTRHRHVAVFNSVDGSLVGYIGPRLGKEELLYPLGLSLDRKGRLYVVDQEEAAVFVVSPRGKLKRRVKVPAPEGGEKPRLVDVEVLDDGSFFVTDNANGQVIGFTGRGKEIARWGEKGRGDGQFMGVTAIEKTSDGRLAVADGQTGKIRFFSPDGRLEEALGGGNEETDPLLLLGGLAVLDSGNLLALDLTGPVIREYPPGASGGGYRSILALDGKAEGLELLGPTGVAVDGEGRIFVVDGIADRLTAFRFEEGPETAGIPGSEKALTATRRRSPVRRLRGPQAAALGKHGGLAADKESCRACHPEYPSSMSLGRSGVIDMPSGGSGHLGSSQARFCWSCHRGGNPFGALPLEEGTFALGSHSTGTGVADAADSWLAGGPVEERPDAECGPCAEKASIRCGTCHDVHAGSAVKFLRASDSSGDYTKLCTSCHPGRFNPGLLGGDNILVRDREAYSSHPVERCSSCHDIHGPPPAAPSSRDALCRKCHQGAGHGKEEQGRGHANLPGPAPDALLLKDGAAVPPPWTAAKHFDAGASPFDPASGDSLSCTSCHDLHGGLPMTPLLYGPNMAGGGFGSWCLNCHTTAEEEGEGATASSGETSGTRTEVVGALIEARKIDDRSVRTITGWMAERLALDREVREELLARWEEAGETERRAVASLFALGKIVDDRAVPALVMALEEGGEGEVREKAAEALAEIRRGVVADRLLDLLLDDRQPIRESAAQSLEAMKPAGIGEKMAPALRDPRWDVREKAVRIAASSEDPQVRVLLVEALDDEKGEVRLAAVEALDETADESVVPRLIDLLDDELIGVRVTALQALARIRDPRALEPIVSLINVPERGVRDEVYNTLAALRDYRVLPLLLRGMREGPVVSPAWKAAISGIDAPEALDYLIEALRLKKGRLVRRYTVPIVASYREDRAVEALIEVLLHDPDGMVRSKAALYLGSLDDPRAFDALVTALLDLNSNYRVRVAAMDILVQKKDPRVIEPLISLLDDPNDTVWRSANASLWEMTCVNYGRDMVRWRDWWEESRDSFVLTHCR